jgi:hypothetical protein
VGAFLPFPSLNGHGISRRNERHDLFSVIHHFSQLHQDFLSYDIIAWIGRIAFPGAGTTLFLHSHLRLLNVHTRSLLVFGFALTFLFWRFALSLVFRIYKVIRVLCIYTVGFPISFFWLDSLHGRRSLCFL